MWLLCLCVENVVPFAVFFACSPTAHRQACDPRREAPPGAPTRSVDPQEVEAESTSQAGASIQARWARGLDIKAGAAKLKADLAGCFEAELVIDRWNRRWQPAATCCGRRGALIAGTPWLDVFCPG
jgi:hypothetical protein